MTKNNTFRSLWPALSLLLALAALVVIPVSAEKPVAASAKKETLQASVDAPGTVEQGVYRSPGSRHKVSVSDRQTLSALKSEGGRVIADYGSFVLLEVNDEVASSLRDSAKAQLVDENNLVLLNAAKIDTSLEKPIRSAVVAKGGKQMRLIQFAGPIRGGMARGSRRHGRAHRHLYS